MAHCPEQGAMGTAIVKEIAGENIIIAMENGLVSSRKAFSCLVSPVKDDKVLFTRQDSCYILAVLERSAGPDMVLDVPGNLSVRAKQGAITAQAVDKVSLSSLNGVETVAPQFTVIADNTTVASHDMTLKSERIQAVSSEVKLFAKCLNFMADQWFQQSKNETRVVEGVETHTSGSLIQNIKKALSIRSVYSTITAKKDMKIDAERIHMG